MTTFDRVVRELEDAPEPLLQEVLDFVRFLKSRRAQDQFDGAKPSEAALAKNWIRTEEDDAWAEL